MSIDVSKLRPFDAIKCKPGEQVVKVIDGAAVDQGRFVAYVEDAALEYRALVKWNGCNSCRAFTTDGRYAKGEDTEVFLPPLDPLDEIDPSPGNVDKLTRRQVGVGYRIPAHDEPAPGGEDMWLPNSRRWTSRTFAGNRYCEGTTYRVPIAPAMVPLGQSDIVLGKTVVRTKAGEGRYLVSAALPTALCVAGEAPIFVTWDSLRVGYEISFDHGVTWQRAEKAG